MTKPCTGQDWRRGLDRLDGAYARATIRAYRADILVFERWCEARGYCPFPVACDVLCRFVEAQGKVVVPNTIRRRLVSIRKAHSLLGLPDPTRDEAVCLTYRRTMRANPVRPLQAAGMTAAYLEAILAAQPETPLGLRNRAMLALGYELLSRRSELVALRDDDLVKRQDGTMRVLIRRSKADPYGLGRIAFTSPETARRVQAWTQWRGTRSAWLFCPIVQGKPVDRALSAPSVSRIIKTAAKTAGAQPEPSHKFSGHSLRVGAAQDLLTRGFATAAIMRAGGWKSTAVLARYLENAEHNVWSGGDLPECA
jgi:site-specific recombinase XerD